MVMIKLETIDIVLIYDGNSGPPILDEPPSNLDILRQFEVMDIIRDLVNKKLVSAIIAIHDLNLASRVLG